MSKISVLVPVYNVEDYLDECILSILNQSHRDIELLLIDDGSTDASGEICDKYGKQDARIKVIHKENGGVSSARNLGLSEATGDYFAFVDADDYIEPLFYEKLLELQKAYNADICISNKFIRVDLKTNNVPKVKIHTKDEALRELLLLHVKGDENIPCSMCGGIYRKDLFCNLEYPHDIHHYEDYLIQVLVVNKAESIVTTTQPFYHYRMREGSANHVNINKKVMSCLRIADRLEEKGVAMSLRQKKDVKSYFIGQCYFRLILSDLQDSEIKITIKEEVKNDYMGLLKSRSISQVDKIMILTYPLMSYLNSYLFGRLLKHRLSQS